MDFKSRNFLGIASSIILMFIPSYSITSGHNIAREFILYFPWITFIYIRPFTNTTPSHMRILPFYISLIISIPSFYVLKYLYSFMDEESNRVEVSMKIVGYSLIQILVILASFLSLEPGIKESRTFVPIPFYVLIVLFGGMSAKWYFVEGYRNSLEPYEIEIEQ